MGLFKRIQATRQTRTAAKPIHPYRSPNKKSHTGARAGVGHAGRKPKVTVTGHPKGPGFPASFPSVRLPNRSAAQPAKKAGIFGRIGAFFRRGK